MEYFVARRIVTTINNKKDKDLLLKYCQQIKTKETFAFIKYITDIEWAIKSNIINDLKLEGPSIANILSKTEKIDFIYETIYCTKREYFDQALDRPNMGKLVSILYSISDFGKYNFKKEIQGFPDEIDFTKCNLKEPNYLVRYLVTSNLTNLT